MDTMFTVLSSQITNVQRSLALISEPGARQVTEEIVPQITTTVSEGEAEPEEEDDDDDDRENDQEGNDDDGDDDDDGERS